MKTHSQRGSAILMIFIAVALFGALAYAFSQGSRTSTGFLSTEQTRAVANQMIASGNEFRQAVTRLRLRGCQDNQINFTGTSDGLDYTNTNSPQDKRCHVFDMAGAGMSFKDQLEKLDEYAQDEGWTSVFTFTADDMVHGIGTTCTNASCVELIAYQIHIQKETCLAINASLGITNPSNDAPVADLSGWPPFNGTYTRHSVSGNIGRDTPELYGKRAGCFKDNPCDSGIGTGTCYVYYQVLLER